MNRKVFIVFCILFCASPQIFADPALSFSANSQTLNRKVPLAIQRKIPQNKKNNLCNGIRDLSVLHIPQVREWVYRFINGRPSVLTYSAVNSDYYRSLVVDTFKECSDLPLALTDLPVIESSYDPYARSRAGALGLWQFMPETGRGIGLDIDPWQDQRRNIILSTQAAAKHLEFLYSKYQSWELSLAAYNCGSGRIDRIMKENPGVDYWDLVESGKLPVETSHYVQKFAAASCILQHTHLFGFRKRNYTPSGITLFTFTYPVSIYSLSQKSGIPESVLYFLNPQLKRSTTPLTQKNYQLVIPKEYVNIIKEKEESLYTMRYKLLKRHVVRKGEYLGKIAKNYNVAMQHIIKINNLQKPYRLYPGNTIYIPVM